MAEPTGPAHLNHRPHDATTAGVVRLYGYALLVFGCGASILASAVPMLLIASVALPLILLFFLINSPWLIGTVVLVPATEKQLLGQANGRLCYAALPVNAAECPRREYSGI